MKSVKFESAARAGNGEAAPPLCSGEFIDCAHGITETKVDTIEAAWAAIIGESKDRDMIPLLLSPLHRLKVRFEGSEDNPHLYALTKRLGAEQVREASAVKVKFEVNEGAPYDPNMPALYLVPATSAARFDGQGTARKIVCNPQTPVRDWFRILNHSLSTTSDKRLLPLLVREGTATLPPQYAAVEVPAAGSYFERHLELRKYGVDHKKDPGIQWAVCCDYTKATIKDMQTHGVEFAVREIVMAHSRALRGVLTINYDDEVLQACRDRFNMRLEDADM
jgi:hypothetical protein